MEKAKRIIVGIVGTAAGIVFAVVLVHALFYSSFSDLTVPWAHADSVSSSDYPVLLVIPALSLHTNVQQVGMTASGKMAVPTNFTDVGWYKYGTLPGQVGSAVIDGHVDDGLALPGVFVNLDTLAKGDDIYIVTKGHHTLHFVVTGSQAYDKSADTSSIFDSSNQRLLRLITCTGNWLPLQRTHDQRLVVTAVLR